MTETDPNDFTDREKFILGDYRSKELSGSRVIANYDLAIGLISIVCVALFFSNGETAFAFVAYALVIGRLF